MKIKMRLELYLYGGGTSIKRFHMRELIRKK